MNKTLANDPETNFQVIERLVYIKTKDTKKPQQFLSDVDREVFENEGKVRNNLKLFNEKNVLGYLMDL